MPDSIDPPAIDTEKIIQEVTSRVSEAMGDVVGDKVKATVEEVLPKSAEALREDVVRNITETLAGKTEDPNIAPWVREKRNPHSYEEVADWGRLQAKREFETSLSEREAKAKQAQEEAEKARLAGQSQLAQQWDSQLKELTTKEFIPAPAEEVQAKLSKNEKLSEEDLKDPGIEARRELYRLGQEHQETNLELVFYKYYLPEKSKVEPGRTAPVIGRVKGSSNQEGEISSYEDLHSGSLSDIAARSVR